MSEQSLQALVDICIEAENWRAYRHEYLQVIERTKARIARAEAAERLAEALMRTIHGGANQFAEWGLIDQYRAAREAVRKLEDVSKPD